MQAVRDITLGRASLAHCKEELRLFSASTVPGTPPFGRAAQCPRTGAAPSVRGQRRQVVLQSVRPLQRHFARRQQRSAERPCRRSRLAPSGRVWRCSSPRKRLGPRGGAAWWSREHDHGAEPHRQAHRRTGHRICAGAIALLRRRHRAGSVETRGWMQATGAWTVVKVLLGVKFVNLTIFGSFFRHKQVEARNSIAATARLPEVGVQNSIQSSKILVVIIRVRTLVGIGAFFHI